MSTYKALVISAFDKPIAVQELPTPTITPGSALINPLYAGLQPYSRAIFTGKVPYPLILPLTPGTTCIARVEAVGADATSLNPGDIVWVDATILGRDNPDNQILLALHGGSNAGSQKLMADVWRNGCCGEKTLVPLENCHVLPESLFKTKEEGGMGYHFKDLSTLSTVLVPYGGLESAGVGAGTTVIVAPATGKFSGGAVLAALAMGAKVIAAGRNEAGLQKLFNFPGAKERLTTVKLQSDVEKDAASLLAATGGKGAHVYIDLSPPAASGPTTASHIKSSILALRRNGQAVMMGGVTSNIELNYGLLMFQNISVRGQFMYDRRQIEQFIQMLENGNLILGESVGLTVAGSFPMEKAEEALDLAEKGTGWGNDVLVAPNGEEGI
ncbi:isopropanol dehydrogenase [Lindgomyces ingoldianus]|uniref:Isopropanol dehydrogenase n=1 Tax=Lindgomyces ingoldianus TaxID=673940 RepID=A0ACB6QSL3_9PLEO|nr:isopropanol dehydrogenase [Lindgomyces ingoldianus]KAF2469979.1 isopropanol dehydrogenase [Lindgomyces ingoldianus]